MILPTLDLKRASYLLIVGAFFCFAVLFVFRVSSGQSPAIVNVKTVPVDAVRTRDRLIVDFDSVAYYRPIIEYNLFRPLGWTPLVPVEPYRLVGTIFPHNTEIPPQAIIETIRGGVTHIVSVGESLDNETTVTGIESKSVVLETSGVPRTLTLTRLLYLNPSRSKPLASEPIPSAVRRTSVVRQRGSAVLPAVLSENRAEVSRGLLYSEWQTAEGERIRFGDARLKNPQKWGLRRR